MPSYIPAIHFLTHFSFPLSAFLVLTSQNVASSNAYLGIGLVFYFDPTNTMDIQESNWNLEESPFGITLAVLNSVFVREYIKDEQKDCLSKSLTY